MGKRFGKTKDMLTFNMVMDAILSERIRQNEKWGEQNHEDEVWALILGEEYGELQKAILEGDQEAIDEELQHVTAVSAQWMEARIRRFS